MLRFDKAITFLPILKSNLSISFDIKICGLGVLLFTEFIYILSVFYIFMDLMVIVYFFSYLFRLIQRINNCLISFDKLSEFLPAFTCVRAIGNL